MDNTKEKTYLECRVCSTPFKSMTSFALEGFRLKTFICDCCGHKKPATTEEELKIWNSCEKYCETKKKKYSQFISLDKKVLPQDIITSESYTKDTNCCGDGSCGCGGQEEKGGCGGCGGHCH